MILMQTALFVHERTHIQSLKTWVDLESWEPAS